MFRFFRKIRYKLLDEGHLSKYCYYAIGEILLVVIGILLALEIDQYWKDVKNRDLEKQFISRLITDLNTDSIELQNNIKNTKVRMAEAKNLYKFVMQNEDVFERRVDVLLAAQTSGRMWTIQFSSNTFDELISNGTIELIRNRQIIANLKNYYNNLREEWFDLYRKRLWDDYLPNVIDALPLDMHIQILDQDNAAAVLTVDDYDIKLSDKELDKAIQTLLGSENFETKLKSVIRTHYLHIMVLDDLLQSIQTLTTELEEYQALITQS